MTASSPRAYQRYPGVTAAPPSPLLRHPGCMCASDSSARRSRNSSAARYSSQQPFHHRLAAAVEPLERPVGVPRLGVRREHRQRDGVVAVHHHGAGELVGIDLAPAHRLRRRGAGESAGVGARVGHLEEVVVAPLVDAEHLLDLRLGLEHEVLGAAAADDEHAALAAAALGLEHDRRGLVDVGADVEPELAARQGLLGHVHADRAVARRAGVDRHFQLVRRREHRSPAAVPAPSPARARTRRADSDTRRCSSDAGTPPGRRPRGRTGRWRAARCSRRRRRRSAPRPCRAARRRSPWGVPRCIASPSAKCASWYRLAPVEMTQSTNPASISGMRQLMPRPGRRHRAGQRHADGDVGLEHPLGEELAAFAQPARRCTPERRSRPGRRRVSLPVIARGIDALAAEVGCRGSGHALILGCGRRDRSGFSAGPRRRSRTASAGSSVTWKRLRSDGLILRSRGDGGGEPVHQARPVLAAEQHRRGNA